MKRFAFIIHPLSVKDVARKYPIAKFFPDSWVEALLVKMSPKLISHITGITSKTGATTEGWFIACPLTPHQMTTLPENVVYDKIVACADMAEKLGADILGLGAFTAVVGDGGITVAKRSKIAVTSGNSYTVATAIQGLLKACEMVGVPIETSTLAVVGATGSIGKTCAKVLSERFGKTVLVGRDAEKTEALAKEIPGASWTTDVNAIREADAIVTVTSADAEIILPNMLKPGCVICDVARPRDVSKRVAKERPDVLVIEGGVVHVPGDVDFDFNFGFPAKTAYACMSETMMLALEERIENFTLGKDVSVEQVEETIKLAEKHGFELQKFRSFEKAVDDAAIERARHARETGKIPVPVSASLS